MKPLPLGLGQLALLGLLFQAVLGCSSNRHGQTAEETRPSEPVRSVPPTAFTVFDAKPDRNPPHAWLEIDSRIFESNLRALQAQLSPGTKLCAVMKADAYGHGMAMLAPSIVALGVPYVGIAANDEARLLRAAGYQGRVMRIRLALADEMEAGLRYDIEETVGNLIQATSLASAAQAHARTVRVHVALNSGGMSRHGIEMETEQGRQEALAIARLPHLKIVGIMSHFPVEDKTDIERAFPAFERQSLWIIAKAGLKREEVTLHCANSYATHVVPRSRLDMVRCGSALYGDTAAYSRDYRHVMALKSRVAALQRYPEGNTVSYDRTFRLGRNSVLANVPLGYSDGYRRSFSGKAKVLIRGKRCPVLGRVTMNTIVVDVTDYPDIQSGDEVVLFGTQGSDEITQAELENAAETLWVELAIAWGAGNPRVLKK